MNNLWPKSTENTSNLQIYVGLLHSIYHGQQKKQTSWLIWNWSHSEWEGVNQLSPGSFVTIAPLPNLMENTHFLEYRWFPEFLSNRA